jgi:hypothetical protein
MKTYNDKTLQPPLNSSQTNPGFEMITIQNTTMSPTPLPLISVTPAVDELIAVATNTASPPKTAEELLIEAELGSQANKDLDDDYDNDDDFTGCELARLIAMVLSIIIIVLCAFAFMFSKTDIL